MVSAQHACAPSARPLQREHVLALRLQLCLILFDAMARRCAIDLALVCFIVTLRHYLELLRLQLRRGARRRPLPCQPRRRLLPQVPAHARHVLAASATTPARGVSGLIAGNSGAAAEMHPAAVLMVVLYGQADARRRWDQSRLHIYGWAVVWPDRMEKCATAQG